MDQITNRVRELREKAAKVFQVKVPEVHVSFDLKGTCMAKAYRRGSDYMIRFNAAFFETAWEHVLYDTVPHEMAHIVCFAHPSLGKNHDSGWKSVCVRLGGTGHRCHNEQVVFAKGKTYKYITTTGAEVRISQVVHKRILSGRVYDNPRKAGGGEIHAGCKWTLL